MSEDIRVQRTDLAAYLSEQVSLFAAFLGILRPPINISATAANLTVAVESLRDAANVLVERGTLSEAEHLLMHAVENWITAVVLCHARSYHGALVLLRQARYHTVASEDLIRRALAAVGGTVPPPVIE